MARHSKFQNFVCSLPYSDPQAMLGQFFPEMQASANAAGASIESVGNVVIDGNCHYLPSIDGKNDQKQYYVANLKVDKDGTVWPAITFGSFYPHYDNQVRDAQEAARQAAIADWSEAVPVNDLACHAYIAKKQMDTVYGDVRVAVQPMRWLLYINKYSEWRTIDVCNAGDLLIPAWDGDPKTPGIANIQRIDQNGTKRFLAGGKISETYHLIQGGSDTILTAEGWATGQTLQVTPL